MMRIVDLIEKVSAEARRHIAEGASPDDVPDDVFVTTVLTAIKLAFDSVLSLENSVRSLDAEKKRLSANFLGLRNLLIERGVITREDAMRISDHPD